jgi:hypothetical protein
MGLLPFLHIWYHFVWICTQILMAFGRPPAAFSFKHPPQPAVAMRTQGEEVVLFTQAESPIFRDAKKK